MNGIEIFKLFGSIFVDNSKANQSIDDTDKKGKGVATTLGNGIKTAAKWGAGIVAGATAAGGAMLGLAKNTADYAGNILDASRKSSLTTENLQQLKYAGDQAGVSMEDIVNSSAKLARALGEGVNGNKLYSESFRELGVDMTDASGKARSSNDVYNDVLMKLAELGDTAESTRLGNDLFGKSFANLKPLLAEGTDGIDALKNKASELGLVMSDDAVRAGDDFGDSMDSLKETFAGMVRSLSADFMPMLQTGINYITQNMPTIKDVVGNVFDGIKTVVTSAGLVFQDLIIPALQSLWDWISPHFPEIEALFMSSFGVMGDILTGVVDAFKLATQWIQDHWNIVGPILAGIAAGIITFKLITGAIAAYGAITKAITAVQLFFNTALAANPIGIVAIAIGALVTAGVLLWKNWDTVKEKAGLFWDYLKDVMRGPVNFILGAINTVIGAYEGMINGLGSAINKIPKIKIPDWVPLLGGKEFGIPKIPEITLPKIPLLAEGGDITRSGRAIVGDEGPEILDLPRGARVTPLDKIKESEEITNNIGMTINYNVTDKATAEYANNDLLKKLQSRGVVLGLR